MKIKNYQKGDKNPPLDKLTNYLAMTSVERANNCVTADYARKVLSEKNMRDGS
jgi:hypothetical protein